MFACLLFIALFCSSFALKPAVIQLTQPVDHAEGPVWDNRTQLLYFVDIHAGEINSYDINNDVRRSIRLNGEVAIVVPSRQDPAVLIVGLNRSVAAVEWDGKNELKSTEILTTVDDHTPTNRFNDGKADKEGRLWFGTMGYEDADGVLDSDKGSLYFITRENLKDPRIVRHPVNISNGLAWNKANDKFYYTDTPTDQVVEYEYDNFSGEISNPKVVFDMADFSDTINGHPDGLTIDAEDNLWIALYDGGAVVRVDPKRKEILQIVAIPAQYTTSVCWGGPQHDILFVTTSRYMLSETDRKRQPAAGSVFAVIDLGTHGLPSFTADIIDFEK